MSLNEKVALVTGATRGIGAAIAMALGRKGAIVVGTATSQEGADKITENLKAQKIKGQGFVLDVCNSTAVDEVTSKVIDTFGPPLILVNNAGITQDNLLLRMKEEQWAKVIETNLNSVYRVTKPCLKGMLKARWGRVINISSVVGSSGNPGQANYAAAKAGMIGFTKSLALEMAGVGITANVIAPGFIQTDMTERLTDQQKKLIHDQIPMKKIGSPDDIANLVVFLASDEAGYITGQTLHVNGGLYMGG